MKKNFFLLKIIRKFAYQNKNNKNNKNFPEIWNSLISTM